MTDKEEHTPAFIDGYRAFRAGEPLGNCPRVADATVAPHWRRGWITARDDQGRLGLERRPSDHEAFVRMMQAAKPLPEAPRPVTDNPQAAALASHPQALGEDETRETIRQILRDRDDKGLLAGFTWAAADECAKALAAIAKAEGRADG